ncbi:MAG: SusC/RagA family TonB-linked outer membrane protein [Gemmatimonadota bacterium]
MSHNRVRSVLACLLLLIPGGIAAQDGTVFGTVKTRTGEPVRGAQVYAEGRNVGTLTNDAGVYRLVLASGSVTLVAQSIGYSTESIQITVTAGASARQDFVLTEQAISLEEVVVTGTAGRLERRAQAAVVEKLDAARLTELAPVNNVQTLLQARVPGVHLDAGSGSVGTAPRIRIRGQASISLSNEPLVFVDGVRMDSRAGTGSNNAQMFSVLGQSVSRMNDLAPEDIESIEVVKGPAAATLYGADASAGVINIITKRGRASGQFTQTISAEYSDLKTSFDAPANWAACSATHVADPNRSLCFGQSAGTIVSDNPLERLNVFNPGQGRGLSYSLRGGGQDYGVFISASADDEDGTLPNNSFQRLSFRSNFDFVINPELRIEGGFGIGKTKTRLPHSDNSVYGMVAAGFLGSPTTVGTAANGLYSGAGVGGIDGRAKIENFDDAFRFQPRLAVNWAPRTNFTNRFIVGADLTRTSAWQFYPKNDGGWYGSDVLNSGQIQEGRETNNRFTIDYLGNLALDLSETLRTDISWGLQTIADKNDQVFATGQGLVANSARSVGAASTVTGNQLVSENRSNGVFGQVQTSWKDKFFMQVAGRLDRNSSFGLESQYFFSPKVGFSYVISEEGFWQDGPLGNLVSTMRLRGAFGTTGRSPTTGALATYNLSPFVLYGDGSVQPGVTPNDPGNTTLKPERGTEYELGFEAGLLDERLSLEVTYFDKTTTDAILRRPIAPSLGFSQNPFVNIGEVNNKGFEVGATARVITQENLGWELRGTLSTVKNTVVDLGDVDPFGTLLRTREGAPINSFHTSVIRSVDVAAGRAIVSDTLEFVGNTLPGWESTLSSTLNLFSNFTLYAQLDLRGDVYKNNFTDDFRDRQFRNSERWIKRNELLSEEERIRRFGPFVNESGNTVTFGNVNGEYIEDASYTRLREVSLTYQAPESVARAMRARSASFTVAGRNLATWTPYSGLDPETTFNDGREFFTVPAERRWSVRVNLAY